MNRFFPPPITSSVRPTAADNGSQRLQRIPCRSLWPLHTSDSHGGGCGSAPCALPAGHHL